MSFADPQSVTVNAVAQPMARTGSGVSSGAFAHADGTFFLDISHQKVGESRNRRMIKLRQSKITADPYNSDRNIKVGMSTYLVVDAPTVGFTNTELKYVVDALTAYLSASSGAKVTQLLGGEQ